MENGMDKNRQFKKIKIGLMRSEKFVGLSGIMMMGKTTMDYCPYPQRVLMGATRCTTQSLSGNSLRR
jgi:hypothetical protein